MFFRTVEIENLGFVLVNYFTSIFNFHVMHILTSGNGITPAIIDQLSHRVLPDKNVSSVSEDDEETKWRR